MCNCTYLPPPSKVPAVNHQVDIGTIGLPCNDHSFKFVLPVTDQDEISMVDSIVVYPHKCGWEWAPEQRYTKNYSVHRTGKKYDVLWIYRNVCYTGARAGILTYIVWQYQHWLVYSFADIILHCPFRSRGVVYRQTCQEVYLKERKCKCLDKSMKRSTCSVRLMWWRRQVNAEVTMISTVQYGSKN